MTRHASMNADQALPGRVGGKLLNELILKT